MILTTIPYWLFYVATASGAFIGTMTGFLVTYLWRKAQWSHKRAVEQAREDVRVPARAEAGESEPKAVEPHPATVLAGPPMVGQYTLRDWLVHYTHREDIWAQVTVDFYDAAAADPKVLAVFERVALERDMPVTLLVSDVQRHFTGALIILAHLGLTVRLAQTLQDRHAHLGITDDIYLRTITALAQVLTRYGTPQSAMDQLTVLAGELQPYVVTA